MLNFQEVALIREEKWKVLVIPTPIEYLVSVNKIMKARASDREIVSIFQRYLSSNDPSEINKLNLEDLAVAEVRLGLKGVEPKFREVIKNRIRDLELKESRRHESKVRAWNLVTGFILGLAVAGASLLLFRG